MSLKYIWINERSNQWLDKLMVIRSNGHLNEWSIEVIFIAMNSHSN